jgi:hypothetical protein
MKVEVKDWTMDEELLAKRTLSKSLILMVSLSSVRNGLQGELVTLDVSTVSSRLSKRELLERCYGGRWKYKGFCGWFCDDGRFVTAVSNGVDENDNPYGGPFRYCLYGDGRAEWIDWYKLVERVTGDGRVSA